MMVKTNIIHEHSQVCASPIFMFVKIIGHALKMINSYKCFDEFLILKSRWVSHFDVSWCFDTRDMLKSQNNLQNIDIVNDY